MKIDITGPYLEGEGAWVGLTEIEGISNIVIQMLVKI